MPVIVGNGGARRNAAAALCEDGRVVAACEQERLTRVRGAGIADSGLPAAAVETVLGLGGRALSDVGCYALAEQDIALPVELPCTRLSHHFGHVAASFLTSPFDRAAILVCDRQSVPEVSVWYGHENQIVPEEWAWHGQGFASLYSRMTELLGFTSLRDEHRLEAIARLSTGSYLQQALSLVSYTGDSLRVGARFGSSVSDWVGSDGQDPLIQRADVAASMQRLVGELLLQLLRDLQKRRDIDDLCLAGGLFFNTCLNTVVHQSGIFTRTFVPANPGHRGP